MEEALKQYSRRDQLKPVCELNPNDLQLLFESANLVICAPGDFVDYDPENIQYLLEGSIDLISDGFITESFSHLDNRSLNSIFNADNQDGMALLTSHGAIVKIDQELFDGLYLQQAVSANSLAELTLEEEEAALFDRLLEAFQQKKLELPALPEAALKIRQVINTAGIGTTEIIQIVQTDPVLSARLVKVANSPLYGTWREIKSVRDAVRRLGLETTRNLSFSLSIKQLFKANTRLIQREIKQIYDESIAISALAFVITQHRADQLDPEQALLTGLMQKLGLIPILKFVDSNPSLLSNIDSLQKSLINFTVPISTLLFQEWHFDASFIDAVEEAENWYRDSGDSIDYIDIVIAARIVFKLEAKTFDESINLDQLPVVKKLDLLVLNDEGFYFFEQAKQEIENMRKLLKS